MVEDFRWFAVTSERTSTGRKAVPTRAIVELSVRVQVLEERLAKLAGALIVLLEAIDDGREKTAAIAIRQLLEPGLAGVGATTYFSRLRIGWSKVAAASTPPGPRGRRDSKTQALYEYRGKRMSLFAWSKELRMSYRTLLQRVHRGLTLAEAVAHPRYGPLPKR